MGVQAATGDAERRGMSRELEDRIRELAAAQHGVVGRAQLIELGLTGSAIGRRVRSGRMRAAHRGVYLVGPSISARTRAMAAALAGGPGVVVSHLDATLLWQMVSGTGGPPIHLTTAGGTRRSRAGLVFHRSRSLSEDERGVVDGIPVTSPFRTLVDVAPLLGARELERAVAVAEREGLVSAAQLAALPERYRGRPGIDALRELILRDVEPAFTRSEAERRGIDLIDRHKLPRPRTNVRIGPYELDLFWPEERVAVEIDGHAHHSVRPHFDGDRRKGAWLGAQGIEVIRLSWKQITREACPTAVQIGQILALARERQRNARGSQAQDGKRAP